MEGYGLRLNKRIGEPEGTKEENKAIGFLIFSHLFARNPLSYPPFTPSECSHKLKTLEFTGLVMRSFYFTSQHRAEN